MSKLRKFRVIFTRFNCDIENKTKQIINNNFHGKQLKTFGILFFTFRFRFHCNTLSEVSSRSLVTAVIMWHCGWRYVRWACVWCSVVTATNKNATLLCVGGCIRLTIKVHDINFIRYWKKIASWRKWKTFTCLACRMSKVDALPWHNLLHGGQCERTWCFRRPKSTAFQFAIRMHDELPPSELYYHLYLSIGWR